MVLTLSMQFLSPSSASKRPLSRWYTPARTECASQRGSMKEPCSSLAPFAGFRSGCWVCCAALAFRCCQTRHASWGR
eukprot:14075575-Alexandrium_andersonii.AAC.1